MGWLGEANVSCVLRHRDIQLRLVYNLARPAILAAGKGRRGVFISSVSSLSFIFLFLPCPSFSSPLLSLLSLFSLSLGADTKCPTRVDVSLIPNTIQQRFSWSLDLFLRTPRKIEENEKGNTPSYRFQHAAQRAHNVKMTSYQRRCDVITSHRRWYDVILMLCARWEGGWGVGGEGGRYS